MAYPYYQQSNPSGYGIPPQRFAPPPPPSFQPQATWGGLDYYRAHAGVTDPYLFNHAWGRVRELGGAPPEMAVGLHEARHWHRQAYSAVNGLETLSAAEIGHAAAYEAYRTWIHNQSMYEPISSDIERQREALTGLAVGEAERLMRLCRRPLTQYERLTTSEAAAHTASCIFYQVHDEGHRSRRRYGRDYEEDDFYAQDDDIAFPGPRGRSQSRARHRSRSRHSMFPPDPLYPDDSPPRGPYPGYSAPLPGAMSAAMPYGQPGYSPYPSAPIGMHQPSLSMHGSSYHGAGVPMSAAQSGYPGMPSMQMQPAYSTSGAGMYPGSVMGTPMVHMQGMPGGMGYPQHMGTAVSTASMGTAVPSTQVVIHKGRKHKHRSHRKHSRSSERGYRSSGGY